MNNRAYRRPMFRKGGSADSAGTGITSGLAPRQGYNVGKRVTDVMGEMRSVLPERNSAKRRFSDLLIDFGLDIATRSPMGSGVGGAISTALASAKDPFAKFQQSRAASEGFDDKLALGAYDVVKGEQAAAKEQTGKEDLIRLEADLNPKLKKIFREELPVSRINEYADTLEGHEIDFINNGRAQIADDVITFKVFREDNPTDPINEKQFVGLLPFEYDRKTGKPIPDYTNISVGQVFYNPEENLFYERIADEGIDEFMITDFRALDPKTYE